MGPRPAEHYHFPPTTFPMPNNLLKTVLPVALALALSGPRMALSLPRHGPPAKARRVRIAASELPTAVRQAIAKQYPGYHVDDAQKTGGGQSGTTYRVELEGRGNRGCTPPARCSAAGPTRMSATKTESLPARGLAVGAQLAVRVGRTVGRPSLLLSLS